MSLFFTNSLLWNVKNPLYLTFPVVVKPFDVIRFGCNAHQMVFLRMLTSVYCTTVHSYVLNLYFCVIMSIEIVALICG